MFLYVKTGIQNSFTENKNNIVKFFEFPYIQLCTSVQRTTSKILAAITLMGSEKIVQQGEQFNIA